MKQEKGITLIALVITIIVLLILAAVSISTLTGENGILIKGSNAKIETEYASVLEQLRMKLYEKSLDIENKQTEIEYLKAEKIIKEPEVAERGKQASTNEGLALASEAETKYIVEVEKLVPNLSTGKGNLETGDVYYILNGNLHYLSDKKEEKQIGLVFTTKTNEAEEVEESWFNYRINENNEVEIIGLNFDKMEYERTESLGEYGHEESAIKLDIETLVIPAQIQGKQVTKVGFGDNIISEVVKYYIVQGVKEIVYPDTLQVLAANGNTNKDIIFEDVEKINLPKGLTEISGRIFWCCNKVTQITIPASVKKITGTPFNGWQKTAVINIEGKDGKEDFEELDEVWNCYSYHMENWVDLINNINYLGK
jgi:competence protein ComGC